MCDVFSGIRSDYMDTNGFKKNATFDYYFLSVSIYMYYNQYYNVIDLTYFFEFKFPMI